MSKRVAERQIICTHKKAALRPFSFLSPYALTAVSMISTDFWSRHLRLHGRSRRAIAFRHPLHPHLIECGKVTLDIFNQICAENVLLIAPGCQQRVDLLSTSRVCKRYRLHCFWRLPGENSRSPYATLAARRGCGLLRIIVMRFVSM